MTTLLQEGSFDALIFDRDGTLVDTTPVHLQGMRTVLAQHGWVLTDEFYYHRAGWTLQALFDDFEAKIAGGPIPREEIIDQCIMLFRDNLRLLEEITVVAEIARTWKGKVPMAVGSNGRRPVVEMTLAATGLLPLFDFVVVSADVPEGKPAPDLFLEAARLMKVPASRCVVFEDTDEGLEAARSAGMDGRDIRKVFQPKWKSGI